MAIFDRNNLPSLVPSVEINTTNLSVGVIIESDTQQSGYDAMSYLGTMKLEREHLFSNECFLDKFRRKKKLAASC